MRTDRRGFLAALAALPVVGGLFKHAEPPTQNDWIGTPNGEPIVGIEKVRDRLYVRTPSATFYLDGVKGPMTPVTPPGMDLGRGYQGTTYEEWNKTHPPARTIRYYYYDARTGEQSEIMPMTQQGLARWQHQQWQTERSGRRYRVRQS